MADNPLDQAAVIRDRLVEIAKGMGILILNADFTIGPKGGPHLLSAMFVLDDSAPPPVDDPATKKQFDDMMRDQTIHDREEEARNAAQRAARMLAELNEDEDE